MPNLIVITFDSAETAGQVREDLRSIQRENQLSLDDSEDALFQLRLAWPFSTSGPWLHRW